jgi:hypothetical protein
MRVQLTRPSLFNKLWHMSTKLEGIHPFNGETDYQKYCSGWLVLYEVHQIHGNNRVVFSQSVSLDADEIALQMQFSFRLSPVGCWKFKFPLAIGPDLRTVAVLRTITTFDIQHLQSDRTLQYHSNVPNLGHSERFRGACSKRPLLPTLPYRYEWLFSHNSVYAVFRDWDMHNAQGSIAVFRVQCGTSGTESALIRLQRFDEERCGNGLRLCAVHPLEHKLLLLNHDLLMFMDLEHGKIN